MRKIISSLILVLIVGWWPATTRAATLAQTLSGRIVLQVEKNHVKAYSADTIAWIDRSVNPAPLAVTISGAGSIQGGISIIVAGN